jgi:CheY-like chemotaxis protein
MTLSSLEQCLPPVSRPNGFGAAPSAQAKQKPPAILLVDDVGEIRLLGRMILEQAGYTVLEAEQGSEALEIFAGNPVGIDLLIADIVMPGMDAGTLAEKVRALRPDLPILFISGYDYAMMELPTDVTGSYLQKPMVPETLVSKVRNLLKPKSVPASAQALRT